MPLEMATNSSGFWTLRDATAREQMHPLGDPLREGTELYVRPCRLAERLHSASLKPLVVWDVGLGMGANAAACLQEAQAIPLPQRPLAVYSFEKEPEGFQTAVAHPDRFPYLDAPRFRQFALNWKWEERGISWTGLLGDFFSVLHQAPDPEIIFYDPFSRTVNPEFWCEKAFGILSTRCRSQPAVLATYACARRIRESMEVSGWKVAVGPSFGNRNQTTLAVNDLERNSERSYRFWKEPH